MSQACLNCGRSLPDGTVVCPYCHAMTEVTQKISLGDLTWCPACGALVPPEEVACPKCGRIVREQEPPRPVRELDLPEIGETEEDAARTGVMTRIESAIPPVVDESSPSARRDRMPRPRAFAFAALFAVAIVGGAALLITHPWDPTASITRASEPADTSMSGFPGLVESLTGQDRDTEEPDEQGSPSSEESLAQLHETLGSLADKVDESEDALRNACSDGDGSSLDGGLEDAQSTSIAVSNAIATIGQIDDADGERAETIDHLLTLGNWLRNRCDALTDAWDIAENASDLSAASGQVISRLDSATDYRMLFEQNYDAWAPGAD